MTSYLLQSSSRPYQVDYDQLFMMIRSSPFDSFGPNNQQSDQHELWADRQPYYLLSHLDVPSRRLLSVYGANTVTTVQSVSLAQKEPNPLIARGRIYVFSNIGWSYTQPCRTRGNERFQTCPALRRQYLQLRNQRGRYVLSDTD